MTDSLIKENVLKMLRRRNIPQEIKEEYTSNMFVVSDILVFVYLEKVKSETLQTVYSYLEKNNLKKCILIFKDITDQCSKIISQHKLFDIEMFNYKYLLFDPLEHIKTPPHSLVEDETELGNVRRDQLPIISSSDRIVRYYNWKKGSIVRINRNDGVYYRVIQ